MKCCGLRAPVPADGMRTGRTTAVASGIGCRALSAAPGSSSHMRCTCLAGLPSGLLPARLRQVLPDGVHRRPSRHLPYDIYLRSPYRNLASSRPPTCPLHNACPPSIADLPRIAPHVFLAAPSQLFLPTPVCITQVFPASADTPAALQFMRNDSRGQEAALHEHRYILRSGACPGSSWPLWRQY